MPAAVTSASTGPSSLSIRATAAATASPSVTSTSTARSTPELGRRSKPATRCPPARNAAATAAPRPLAAPVTTATGAFVVNAAPRRRRGRGSRRFGHLLGGVGGEAVRLADDVDDGAHDLGESEILGSEDARHPLLAQPPRIAVGNDPAHDHR